MTLCGMMGVFVWNYALENTEDGSINTENFEIINFPGGLYAVAITKDGADIGRVVKQVQKWVDENEFFEKYENKAEYRTVMMHIVTPRIFKEKMGYELAEIYVPIVARIL